MKTIEAIKLFSEYEKKTGYCVLSRQDLENLFQDSARTLEKSIERLVKDGLLERVARGMFVYKMAVNNQHILEHIAWKLRQYKFNYISLESALSAYGRISQIPMMLTVMTTGRSGWFDTPYGTIEFVHTGRNRMSLSKRVLEHGLNNKSPLLYATESAALADLKRVGRNMNMVDEGVQ